MSFYPVFSELFRSVANVPRTLELLQVSFQEKLRELSHRVVESLAGPILVRGVMNSHLVEN
jgi:hypothetical protein